jgi:hypothetical protein
VKVMVQVLNSQCLFHKNCPGAFGRVFPWNAGFYNADSIEDPMIQFERKSEQLP